MIDREYMKVLEDNDLVPTTPATYKSAESLIDELRKYSHDDMKKKQKEKSPFRLPTWMPELSINIHMPPILSIRTDFMVKNFGRMTQDFVCLNIGIFKWTWSFELFCRESRYNDYSTSGYASTFAGMSGAQMAAKMNSSSTPPPF